MYTLTIETHSPEETVGVGSRLARALEPGDILLLEGPFGAGKTTLVQGIARGLDVTEYVSSPSFVMVNEYQGRVPVFHIDLYRQELMDPLTRMSIEEYLFDDGVSVVEWSEHLPQPLREGATIVRIHILGEDARRLDIVTPQARIMEALQDLGPHGRSRSRRGRP